MGDFASGRRYPIGTVIPAVPEHTRRVPAGAVTLAVEYRVVTTAIVAAHAAVPGPAVPVDDDGGVSLHVYDGAGAEQLRFDAFDRSPHYHYLCHAEGWQLNIPFDPVAGGDMIAWVLATLPERVVPMLRYCGNPALADRVDPTAVAAALPAVRDLVSGASGATDAAVPGGAPKSAGTDG